MKINTITNLYMFKKLNGNLKDITFVMFAVHEQVALMSSS